MRVLVTGGRGHVGRAVCLELEQEGFTTVDVSRTGSVQADLSIPDFAEKVCGKVGACDAVVHCAAMKSENSLDIELAQANCIGTIQVIQLATLLKARHFVYISSVPVIGIPQSYPIKENHATSPFSSYHASKLFGEHITQISNSHAFTTSILRLTSPVGSGLPDGKIFSTFVKSAMNGKCITLAGRGARRQNYVDVRDVGQAVVKCLRAKVPGIFNIAGTVAISNLRLAELCIKVLRSMSAINYTGNVDSQESVHWDVSIEKANQVLGYAPEYSLEESISSLAAEYENRCNQ